MNWSIVRTPLGLVLVDAGYAAQADAVLETVRIVSAATGDELVAVLVTHAHTDHIGALPELVRRHPTLTILAAPDEVEAVRGPEREQITLQRMGTNLLRPKFLAWLREGIRAGGLRETIVPTVRAFTDDDLDSFEIDAVPASGHTVGSTAYAVRSEGVLITGDAFVTDHMSYRRPQVGAIADLFSADPHEAARTAEILRTAPLILPGHGPSHSRSDPSP